MCTTREIALRITNFGNVSFGNVSFGNVSTEMFQSAVGRLAHWGIGIFPRCVIANDSDGNIDATYFRENGDVGFVIGAVWRKQADGRMGYDFNS